MNFVFEAFLNLSAGERREHLQYIKDVIFQEWMHQSSVEGLRQQAADFTRQLKLAAGIANETF